jgi:hypothetical protein
MTADFPTAPLAPGLKGAGGGTVEKSRPASHTKNRTTPSGRHGPMGRYAVLPLCAAADGTALENSLASTGELSIDS